MIDLILSWGGCAGLLFGLWLLGEKRVSGFYVAILAELMWIAWGASTHAWALIAMSTLLTAMYVRGILAWGRK